jgi:hypothetical protein
MQCSKQHLYSITSLGRRTALGHAEELRGLQVDRKLGLGHLKTTGYRRDQRAGGRPILRSMGFPTRFDDR